MTTLRRVRMSDPEYQRARALDMVNELECSRCQARLWFFHEPSDTDEVEAITALSRQRTEREGCMVCDPDGYALEKSRFTLILAVEGGWPGDDLPGENPLVPSRSVLQAGLQRALGVVARVDEWSGENPFPIVRKYYVLRVAPSALSEDVLNAARQVLERHNTGASYGFTAIVTLVAEAGNTLGSVPARLGSLR